MSTTEVTPDVTGASTDEVKSQEPLTDWKARTTLEIRREAERHYQELQLVWQAKDLVELEKKMDAQVQKGVQELFDKWQEAQKPPTKEQIEQLVKQEYATFTIELQVEDPEKEDEFTPRTFVLRELPQTVEEEFYEIFKKQLQGHMGEINALAQKTMGNTPEEKLKAVLELGTGGFKVMAELVKIILNPRGRKRDITVKWVQDNVSSMRQWNIIQAQVEANKLRDFFSKLSQSGTTIQTMTQPPSYQALLQQLQ